MSDPKWTTEKKAEWKGRKPTASKVGNNKETQKESDKLEKNLEETKKTTNKKAHKNQIEDETSMGAQDDKKSHNQKVFIEK